MRHWYAGTWPVVLQRKAMLVVSTAYVQRSSLPVNMAACSWTSFVFLLFSAALAWMQGERSLPVGANLAPRLEGIFSLLTKGPVVNLTASSIILLASGVAAGVAAAAVAPRVLPFSVAAYVCATVGAVIASATI